MKYHLRKATSGDVQGIAAVHVASWNEHYRGIVDDRLIDERTFEYRVSEWNEAIEDPSRLTYVAEEPRGELLGFASVLVLTAINDGFDSYLGLLYLLSDAKGHGIGRALLRVVAEALITRNCKNMALRVMRKNKARAFYEHLGARLVPEG